MKYKGMNSFTEHSFATKEINMGYLPSLSKVF